MRKFISLLKLQLNARYGLSYARFTFRNDKKSLAKAVGIGLVVLFALAEMIGLYSFLMLKLHKVALLVNTPQMILTIAAVVSGAFVLIFGIFFIISSLFLAKDTEFLSSLPLPQGSVFTSKFMLVLIGEYPFAFFLMLPPVIIYGAGAHKGVLYYLTAILCTVFIPLVPLVVSAFFSLILMNVVSRSRRRDTVITVGSIILMLLFIGGQFYVAGRIPENPDELARTLLQSSNAMVEFTGRVFPPAVWITKVLSAQGFEALLNLAYLLAVSAGAFAVVYFIASFIYQRGATAQLETRAKDGKARLSYRSSSHMMAIFRNEWRIIIRTPIYALNSLVIVFIAPIFMLLPLLGGNFAGDHDLQFLYMLVRNGKNPTELMLILAAIVSVMALINPAVSSTFSREGSNFWVLKHIPVKVESQIYGKLLAGYSISFAAIVLTAVSAMLSFGVAPLMTLMIIVLSGLALIPICVWNLYIDFKRPKLVWNSPQEAIKQNANVVLGMLIGFLLMFLFGVVGYFINSLNLGVYAVFCLMVIILAAFAYGSIAFLNKSAKDGYRKLEI